MTDEEAGKTVAVPGPLFHSANMDAPSRTLARPVAASTFTAWGNK